MTTRRPPLALALALAALAWPTLAPAVDADEADPAKIVAAMDARDDGDRQKSQMVMKVRDSAGRERSRSVRSQRMDFPGGSKQLLLFEGPAEVRNTGLLSIDWDDGAKADDQWLYLPALRKSTRIASGDKSGSFMGTDLSYADMTRQDVKSYDYAMIQASLPCGDDTCWLIESRPNNKKTRKETGYVKTHSWISKSKLMPLKVKHWVREGKKLKFIKFADIRQVAGVWTPHKIMAQTKRGKIIESKTVLVFTSVLLNQDDVRLEDFSQRRLEQGL